MNFEVLVIFSITIGFIALCILAFFWIQKNPFKAALGSCLSSSAILVGGLSLPNIEGKFDFIFNAWSVIYIKSQNMKLMTGAPDSLWITAFVSIVFLYPRQLSFRFSCFDDPEIIGHQSF
jgi:hypothetical protein